MTSPSNSSLAELSDAELLRRHQSAGDRDALGELARRYAPMVYSSARRMLGEPTQAEDVMQNVFMTFAKRAREIRSSAAIGPWLLKTTRFSAANARKMESRRHRNERKIAVEAPVAAMNTDPAVLAIQAEEEGQWNAIRPLLDQAIGRLAWKDQTAVVFRFFQGLEITEIATAIGATEEATRKRLTRAIERLRKQLTTAGAPPSACAVIVLAVLLKGRSVEALPAHVLARAVAIATAGHGVGGWALGLKTFLSSKLALLGVIAVFIALFAFLFKIERSPRSPPSQTALPTISSPTLLPTPPAAQPGVAGYVFLPDGKPAVGATVYLVKQINSIGPASNPRADFPSDITDSTGAFRFDQSNLSPRDKFLAMATGYGLTPVNWSAARPAKIPLSLPTRLTMKLLQPDGTPAAGVRVHIRNLGLQNPIYRPDPVILKESQVAVFARTSGPDGLCVLDNLPRGGSLWMDLSDDRFALQSTGDFHVILPEAPVYDTAPIHLISAAQIAGHVFLPTGKPAAGIKVVAQGVGLSLIGAGRGVTGEDGSYHLAGLPAGDYNVALDLQDEADNPWTAAAVEDVRLKSGEIRHNVDFGLISGGEVKAQVVSAENGAPVSGVKIGCHGPAHPQSSAWVQSAETNSAGIATLRVPPGKQYLYIMSSTPVSGFAQSMPINRTISVAEGENKTIEFRLPAAKLADPATPQFGIVLGADGSPAAGASVFEYSDSPGAPLPDEVDTGRDGKFPIIEITGKQIKLRAILGDEATPSAVVVRKGKTKEIKLNLKRDVLASAEGRVLDADGSAIENASVSLVESSSMGGTAFVTSITDKDGNYSFKPLWPDQSYTVHVSAKGFGDAQSSVKVRPGKVTSLNLSPPKKNSSIAGVLLDEAGNPIANQVVVISGENLGNDNVTTDNRGQFRDDVIAGEKLGILILLKDGHGLIQREAMAGDEKIRIQLKPGGESPGGLPPMPLPPPPPPQ